MYYVYILACADETFYTGIAIDPQRRLKEHNASDKLGARYTRSRRPVRIVYLEKCRNRSEATKIESMIKKLKREDKIKLIKKYG